MAEFSIFDADPAGLQSFGWEGDTEILTLGTEFYTDTDAWVTHLRYPHVLTNSKPSRKTMALYEASGVMVVGPLLMPTGTPGQWNALALAEPFKLVPAVRYRAAAFYPDGGYAATPQYFHPATFGASREYGPITVPSSAGTYKYDTAISFPDGAFNAAAYYSDVVVSDVDPTVIVDPPAASNIFGADGAAYTSHALINGTLVPVAFTP